MEEDGWRTEEEDDVGGWRTEDRGGLRGTEEENEEGRMKAVNSRWK